MRQKHLELLVGVFVALGLAAFLWLAIKVSDIASIGEDKGYRVTARFENIGGLKIRAPVTLAGVRIGRVASINLDPQTFEALVTLAIEPQYDRLPSDSSASILTSGLLGEQHVGLEPGGMDDFLKNGGSLKLTQSALVLEKLIGRMFTNAVQGDAPAKAP